MAHFTRFQDAFGYDAIRSDGLPIASGEVESAHRVIPQKRLKLRGAWWHPDMVNPMLALRVVRARRLVERLLAPGRLALAVRQIAGWMIS